MICMYMCVCVCAGLPRDGVERQLRAAVALRAAGLRAPRRAAHVLPRDARQPPLQVRRLPPPALRLHGARTLTLTGGPEVDSDTHTMNAFTELVL